MGDGMAVVRVTIELEFDVEPGSAGYPECATAQDCAAVIQSRVDTDEIDASELCEFAPRVLSVVLTA